jgi:hypothetical protein
MADVKGFGSSDRNTEDLQVVSAELYRVFEQSFVVAGIPWNQCERQDTGDGLHIFAPWEIPRGLFAGALLNELAEALDQHNATHTIGQQIRLKLALNTAEVTRNANGRTFGHGIIHTKRLLDSKPLRQALDESLAPLAVIVSSSFYRDVVKSGPGYRHDVYQRVHIEEKEEQDSAWIRLLDPRPERQTISGLATDQ